MRHSPVILSRPSLLFHSARLFQSLSSPHTHTLARRSHDPCCCVFTQTLSLCARPRSLLRAVRFPRRFLPFDSIGPLRSSPLHCWSTMPLPSQIAAIPPLRPPAAPSRLCSSRCSRLTRIAASPPALVVSIWSSPISSGRSSSSPPCAPVMFALLPVLPACVADSRFHPRSLAPGLLGVFPLPLLRTCPCVTSPLITCTTSTARTALYQRPRPLTHQHPRSRLSSPRRFLPWRAVSSPLCPRATDFAAARFCPRSLFPDAFLSIVFSLFPLEPYNNKNKNVIRTSIRGKHDIRFRLSEEFPSECTATRAACFHRSAG